MGDHHDADPGQDQEWIRESDLINGGLILIGIYMVQPFLHRATRSRLVVWTRVVAQNLAFVRGPAAPPDPGVPTRGASGQW